MDPNRPGGSPASEPWRICAVVVSFHPDDGLVERALRIRAQADGMVVIDNGSGPAVVSRLQALAAQPAIHLIANPDNRGIAAALNQGVAYARSCGYRYALLFDQDTEPLPHMVQTLRQIACGRAGMQQVAVLASNLTDAATGQSAYRFRPGTGEASEVTTAMTSGSLLSVPIWERVGPFREDFFIDHVDEEYCLRARGRGYRILLAHQTLAVHALGAPRFRRILWRTFGTLNHGAVRRYYMTRNHVILIRLYAAQEPAWLLESVWLSIKSFLLLLFIDDDRRSKVRLMARGLRDGLAGRLGKLPADRAVAMQ